MTNQNQNSVDQISAAFIASVRHVLKEGMQKIEHCIEQLSDEQIWWRPRQEMNSIANLMLHLSGNMRQWFIAGVGGGKDVRNRPMEFNDRSNRAKAEILGILKGTVEEVDTVMAKLSGTELLSPRRIQGYDTTAMAASMDSLTHFRGHVQEIIHLTRTQLGDKYRFYFVPKGKEQESAGGTAI